MWHERKSFLYFVYSFFQRVIIAQNVGLENTENRKILVFGGDRTCSLKH